MRVIVGRVGRPHGLRGEVVIGVRTDEPDLRFAVGALLDAGPNPDTLTAILPRARLRCAWPRCAGIPGSSWSRSPGSPTGPRPGS